MQRKDGTRLAERRVARAGKSLGRKTKQQKQRSRERRGVRDKKRPRGGGGFSIVSFLDDARDSGHMAVIKAAVVAFGCLLLLLIVGVRACRG